ncbi:MAG: hypothetical protein U0V72_00630 [Cytophagales bacterium]
MKKSTKKILINTAAVAGGAIVGNIAGAALGAAHKSAPLIGGLATAAGSFMLAGDEEDKEWLKYLGAGAAAGMISAPVEPTSTAASTVSGLSGVDGITEDMKQNAQTAFKNMGSKFFLDKTPMAKYMGIAEKSEVSGIEENLGETMTEEEARAIVAEMAAQAQQKQITGYEDDEMEGIEGYEDEFNGIGSTDLMLGESDDEIEGIEGMEGTDDEDLEGFADYEEVEGIDDHI